MYKEFLGKKVIVRADRAGVFHGVLEEVGENMAVKMSNCRKLWYWSGAAAVQQLAIDGVDGSGCKFTKTVDSIVVSNAIEIIACTQKASDAIEAVKEWKM